MVYKTSAVRLKTFKVTMYVKGSLKELDMTAHTAYPFPIFDIYIALTIAGER